MSLAAVARWSVVVVGLSVSTAVTGCGGPATGELVGQTESPVTFTNDKAAFDYFLGKGLTNFQAAGIVGNLDQESGVDPTAVQAGGPGRGIAQWSVGGRWDTDANDNATWYAAQQGQSVDSLQLQLDFIWYELTTFSNYGLAALQQSTNVTDATVAFQNDFEGCGTCDQSQRIAYAQNVLSTYGNDTTDGGGSTPDAGGTPCTVPGVGNGVCVSTTECAAMPGHVSTPNYCPGPADIQCCTGPANPSVDAGSKGDGAVAVPGDAGVPADDAGIPVHGQDAGSNPSTGSGGAAGSDASASGPLLPADGSAFNPTSKGCSTAQDGAGSSTTHRLASLFSLASAVALATRRRRRSRTMRP
jgi:MYXO-CTERM domain-containing protein